MFNPTAKIKVVEEDQPLFPDYGEVEKPFEKKEREETQVMIEQDDEKPVRQRFIDKLLGRSISVSQKTQIKQVVMPKFDEIEEEIDNDDAEDDLEIPSFLRRR